MNILQKHSGNEKNTHSRAAPQFSLRKCTFLSGPFLSFRHFPLFSVESVHYGVPFLAALQYPLRKSAHSLFLFFHFLSCSFIVLSFSVFFFHCFSFFSSCSSFLLGCSKSFFLPRLPLDFLLKLLCIKSFFGPCRGVPHWAPFFSLVYFSFNFLFSFSISFHVFPVFPLFFLFSFFLYFPFVFIKKCFFLFHFVSLLSFLGCSKSVAALQDSLVKSAHSELASFALCWLVVTFPCMIRLRVVYGGWRVGQVLPPWQNRQISALDETADAPQSCLFSLLSSSQFYK